MTKMTQLNQKCRSTQKSAPKNPPNPTNNHAAIRCSRRLGARNHSESDCGGSGLTSFSVISRFHCTIFAARRAVVSGNGWRYKIQRSLEMPIDHISTKFQVFFSTWRPPPLIFRSVFGPICVQIARTPCSDCHVQAHARNAAVRTTNPKSFCTGGLEAGTRT